MQTPTTVLKLSFPQPERNIPGVEKVAARAVLSEFNN